MEKTFYVEWISPKTGGRGIVEPTKNGVGQLLAEQIARESNDWYKPLTYIVREFKV